MTAEKSAGLPTQNINFHGHAVECQIDPKNRPLVISEGHTFQSLHKLIEAYPELTDQKNFNQLAQLANFLFQGATYKFIDDISAYKEAYTDRIEFEQNTFDYMPMRLIDHGVFDINGMHPPRIINDEFVFFVKDFRTEVPYRVTCQYPFTEHAKGSYHLLPYAE